MKKTLKRTKKGKLMQLVQIAKTEAPKMVSIRELFEQMAQREAQMIREARERVEKQIRTNS